MFDIDMQSHVKKAALLLCVLSVSVGCGPMPPAFADKNLLEVAEVGASREAVLLKLGEPSASFEQGRILTYRIGADDDKGYFLLDRQVLWGGGWNKAKYSLVLVFDEKGLLAKHTMVQVR